MNTIVLHGYKIPYVVQRKNNKYSYLRIKQEGYVLITTSKSFSQDEVKRFMEAHFNIIKEKLDYYKNKEVYDPLESKKIVLFDVEYNIMLYIGNRNYVYFDKDHLVIVGKKNDYDLFDKLLYQFEVEETIRFTKELYQKHYDRISKDFNIDNITFKARRKKSQFGSCNKGKRIISMNTVLLRYDKKYFESVFLHEICHMKYADHSSNFYRILYNYCPKYDVLRKELNELYKR